MALNRMASSSTNRLSAAERLLLVQTLNRLPTAQFEELVLAMNPPSGILPPNFAAQGNRTSELLQWIEGSTGPGLSSLQDIMSLVMGDPIADNSTPVNLEDTSTVSSSKNPDMSPEPIPGGPINTPQFISLVNLTGEQFEQLEQALLSAYPTEAKLKRMVRITFGIPLQSVAEGTNQTERVDQLIEWAETEERLSELVSGAQRQNPGNAKLKAFVASLPASPSPDSRPANSSSQGPVFDWRGPTDERELEGLLRPQRDVTSYDMAFIQKASQPASAVCRVELPNEEAIGTGFLVAKDLLLTNYHVIAPYENSDPYALLEQITLRFGYLTLESGQGAVGKVFSLAPNPLLRFQTVKQGLDYALLKIEDGIFSVPELQPIGLCPNCLLRRDMNIHMLQHPEGQTLRVTFSNNGITGVYEQDGLIQYVSDTALGSSGSPCFNDNWELVAIHHAQMSAPFGVKCEGILFEAIYRDISDILQQYLRP